jgi:hypothetical protein
MQTIEIYKWAKAELERYKKSADYSDISEHYCSFIECELLPKLEESLHTSSNIARAEICPHYERVLYVDVCTCAGKLSPIA